MSLRSSRARAARCWLSERPPKTSSLCTQLEPVRHELVERRRLLRHGALVQHARVAVGLRRERPLLGRLGEALLVADNEERQLALRAREPLAYRLDRTVLHGAYDRHDAGRHAVLDELVDRRRLSRARRALDDLEAVRERGERRELRRVQLIGQRRLAPVGGLALARVGDGEESAEGEGCCWSSRHASMAATPSPMYSIGWKYAQLSASIRLWVTPPCKR